MPVSVPEKTLEHWASLYITYRYRSKAALWWPVDGEDIDVQALPSRPGKAVQLELKTTIAGATQHKVDIDIGQLWEYTQRPFALQPYYVLARPCWQGELRFAARAAGLHATEVAFSRSGAPWWFAEWMIVLTTEQVATILHAELVRWNKPNRGKKETLVRFHHPTQRHPNGHTSWGNGATAGPAATPWREFWSELEVCGRPDWPQVVQVPTAIMPRRARLRRGEILRMLQDAAEMVPFPAADFEWAAIGTDGDGGYVAVTPREPLVQNQDRREADASHRVEVFLDVRALFPAAEE